MERREIGTFELLSVIDRHGANWPAAAPDWGMNETADAIDREIAAGNMRDGGSLTEQGRRWLVEARARSRIPPA